MFHREPTIGIALGGGGVRGLAHLPLLSVFDELNIRPHAIAGTSMGAIIGSLYAAGVTAESIRKELMKHLITSEDDLRSIFEKRKDLLKWIEAFRIEPGTGIRVDGLLTFLYEKIGKGRFEELTIPLTVVAADYWNGDEVLFSHGDLLPAVKASMAVPGVFVPVQHEGRVLVDGGVVNQVPWNILRKKCDIIVAIDVTGRRFPHKGKPFPNPAEAMTASFEILQDSLNQERMKHSPPTIYIRPELENIAILEFDKFETVLKAGEESREYLRARLVEEIRAFNPIEKALEKILPIG